MRVHMAIDNKDFIVAVLNDMLNEDENATLTMYASESDHGKKFLTDLLERPACSAVVDFFASIVDKYTSLCVACFPNVAKMADDAEFAFAMQWHALTPNEWLKEFYAIALNNLTSFCDEVQSFKLLDWKEALVGVELAVYWRWTLLSSDFDRPKIDIPSDVSVHPNSLCVLAYTAGWLVAGLLYPANLSTSTNKCYVGFA